MLLQISSSGHGSSCRDEGLGHTGKRAALQEQKLCLELGCVIHYKPLMGQQPGEGGSAQDLELKVGLWDQVTVPQGGRHLLLHLHQQQNRHWLVQ